LLGELVVRSLGMTLVIVIVGVALQFVLYAEPYGLRWFKLDWFTGFQLPTTLTTQADPLIGEILNQKNHL
jgi:hypothetical protein